MVRDSAIPYSEGAARCKIYGYRVDDQGSTVLVTERINIGDLLIGTPFSLPAAVLSILPVPRITIQEIQLRDLAATVHSEASAAYHDPEESEGIVRVIRNRAELKGVPLNSADLLSNTKNVGSNRIDGRYRRAYSDANAKPIEQWLVGQPLGTGSERSLGSSLAGTITGLVTSRDITKGSFFWEGTNNFNKQHNWVRDKWIGGNDPHYKGTQFSDKFDPAFLWKVDIGGTSFFAYNPKGPNKHFGWP